MNQPLLTWEEFHCRQWNQQTAIDFVDRCRHAHLVFQKSPTGKTYIASQYIEYPFHITRPFYLDAAFPELATLYLQSSSGGIVQGDRLHFAIAVQPQAAVHFTTQAGTKVHTMNRGYAVQNVELQVHSGGYLEYLVDPLILFPRSRLISSTRVRIAVDATLILSESFTCHDPKGGKVPAFERLASEIIIEQFDGKVLAIDRFWLTHAQAVQKVPGIADNSGAQGTIYVISNQLQTSDLVLKLRDRLTEVKRCYVGISTLPNDCGAWIRLLAADSRALRTALEQCGAACRASVTGKPWTWKRK